MERGEPNNTLATTATLNIGPDLIPTAVTASKSGSTLTLTDSVKNQGTASGAFTVRFYLFLDSTYPAGTDIFICSRSVASLAAGASNPTSGTQTTTCTVPSAPAGSYFIIVNDDSGGAVSESIESNNTKATTTKEHSLSEWTELMIQNRPCKDRTADFLLKNPFIPKKSRLSYLTPVLL
ncbi:MAG: hypothetical protein HY282_13515 [Nitrospirae bacterium]|nr:hypothetical protein [Candidatus Manganitrophaceae bacterium]